MDNRYEYIGAGTIFRLGEQKIGEKQIPKFKQILKKIKNNITV